jgi:hypothetical protein
MDLGMTIDAGGKCGEVALAMTFETEGPNIGADQKKPIGRSMRFVAAAAPTDGECSKTRPLFSMTFKAGVLIRKFIPLSQTRARPGPVRGMAVGAFHFPFDDFMAGGKVKLRLHIRMA